MQANTRKAAWRGHRARQRGVAVVTALLLTTLSITIVASLFWQQHVQVRSIENQQIQLQKQWILRGALDWANLILREDANTSSVDHLGEVWAVPLAATELEGQISKDKSGVEGALISGRIIDAQSRYNLKNLAPEGSIDIREVAAFQRLLATLGIDPRLAKRTAEMIAASYTRPAGVAAAPGAAIPAAHAATDAVNANVRILGIENPQDLLAITGVTQEVLDKLKDYVVVLPHPTPVNANTASPKVLAAKMEGLSVDEAAALVAGRDRAYIRDEGDLSLRLQGKFAESLGKDVSVSTNYFLVNASVQLNKGSLNVQALMSRNIMTGSKLIWVHEY